MTPNSTLDRVPRGRSVRVVAVDGDDAIARRLDDLGLRAGVEIAVLRRAPLGDPTVFELHGYQLCLRESESARVRVEAVEPANTADAEASAAPAASPADAPSAAPTDGTAG